MRNQTILAVFLATIFLSACAFAERGGDGGSFHSSGGGGGRGGGGAGRSAGSAFGGSRGFNGWGRASGYSPRGGGWNRSQGYYQRPWGRPNNGYQRYGGTNGWTGRSYPSNSFSRTATTRGWGGTLRPSNYDRSQVPSRLRGMGVGSLPPARVGLRGPGAVPRYSRIPAPRTGPTGGAFHGTTFTRSRMNSRAVRDQMAQVAGNREFGRTANLYNATENRVGRYYWHNWNGVNYCHYYDGWGCNWYGWNCGGGLFWSCWWGGNWWWYDPYYARWDFWWDNAWWWDNPYNADVVYAYDGDGYVPSGDVSAPTDQAPPPAQGAPSAQDQVPSGDVQTYDRNQDQGGPARGVFDSPDGSREVRVTGEGGDAFLYDMVKSGPKPVYLDSNVKDVEYSKPSKGKPMSIVVILKDGTFELFDAQGKRLS